LQKMEETGGIAQKLFNMGIKSAEKKRELALAGKSDLITNLKHKIADKIVFEKIRQRFGGKLIAAITGSATMNIEIGYFFADIGIPAFDCYGLTETSPAVTMNCHAAHKPGSVGKPISDVVVVIDKQDPEHSEEGEIIVYGPNVMQGYHNKEEATKEVMTEDGGFRTGDCGRLDEDGFLFITGRFKEQYKLENGKYVFPAALEEEIKLLPIIENAVIYGDGRVFNLCLIAPAFDALKSFAKKNDLPDPEDREAFIADPKVNSLFNDEISNFLQDKFANYEIPKKIILIKENFTLENGMLTQTMKLKRSFVFEKYMPEIESSYS